MGTTEDLRNLAAPIVAGAGLELWDVELERGTVRILVDRPDGVDLDALSAVSRSLSIALDEHGELAPPDRYQLEVSSPGLERTLRTPAHYRRFVGSQLAVKLRAPLEGARRLRGELIEAGESNIRLVTDAVGDGNPGAGLDVPYSLIERARTVLQWGPAPKPRTSKRTKRSGRAGAPFAPSPKDAR